MIRVYNLQEKQKAWSAIRKFVTSIENQKKKCVRRIKLDQGCKFSFYKFENLMLAEMIEAESIVTYPTTVNNILE